MVILSWTLLVLVGLGGGYVLATAPYGIPRPPGPAPEEIPTLRPEHLP